VVVLDRHQLMQIAVAKTEYNIIFCFITSEVVKFNCSFIVKLNAIHVLLLFLNVKMFALWVT